MSQKNFRLGRAASLSAKISRRQTTSSATHVSLDFAALKTLAPREALRGRRSSALTAARP
jgi:hypothetical protein